MGDAFTRLFGKLPPSITRCEDGTPTLDRSHPEVQKLIASIRACFEAGDTAEGVMSTMLRGFAKGLRKAKEAKDGKEAR